MHWISFDILCLLVIKYLGNALASTDGLCKQKKIAPNALCWLDIFYSGSKTPRARFNSEAGLLPEAGLNCKGDW